MTKYKMVNPLELKEISFEVEKFKTTNPLNLKEIGLLSILIQFDKLGLEINIDNLKRTTCDNEYEVEKIINQLIERHYIEEIKE